uniref:P-type domain-containing protein n=1 Tax=Cyclopterus lumpus TaxID=8103 RepID=A0A8C2WN18_CYCLU
MYTFRHQGEPDGFPGCPRALWVFCKKRQRWQNTSDYPCNLPSEQRLPCGLAPVSQPHCFSIGCCFDGHDCFYPMDGESQFASTPTFIFTPEYS